MPYLLIAYDFEDAFERRLQSRQAHIDYIDKLRDEGKALLGAALIDSQAKMIGSTIFLNMTENELQNYLASEPYLINKVWDKIEIKPCNIGPSFIKK
jgi:uncharacterized protein